MTRHVPVLTDDLLREALTEEPRAGLTMAIFNELTTVIERTPQRRGIRIVWPWSSAMPNVRNRGAARRLDSVATFAVLALLVAISVAMIVLAGSVRRTHPLGSAGLIAFDSGGEIWVANPDGSGAHPITNDSNADVQPTFSPDGRRLAYESLDLATSTVKLVLVDPDGSDQTVVATTPAVARASGLAIGWFGVTWSPDGSRLAFTASVGGAQQIFVVDADGTDAREIGDPALEGHDPAWSPDGTRIAFLGGHFDDERGVFVMGTDGSAPRRLGPPTGEQWANEFGAPAWSPDSTRVAFSAGTGSTLQVFVDDLNGMGPRAVSLDDGQDATGPAWSPDGTRLAWHLGTTTSVGNFAVARLDGSAPAVLSPTVLGTPTWSPDGTKLIGYRSNVATGSRDRLVVIDLANGRSIEVPAEAQGDASWQRLAP